LPSSDTSPEFLAEEESARTQLILKGRRREKLTGRFAVFGEKSICAPAIAATTLASSSVLITVRDCQYFFNLIDDFKSLNQRMKIAANFADPGHRCRSRSRQRCRVPKVDSAHKKTRRWMANPTPGFSISIW
jgi:hypothetical protein